MPRVCPGMLALMNSTAGWALALAVAASPVTESKTCQRLDTAYQASVDVTADALRHYRQCVSERGEAGACGIEFSNFRTAQEELQASFSSYAKACGSTAVQLRRRDPQALAFSRPVRDGS
jgi:hypothetical protein